VGALLDSPHASLIMLLPTCLPAGSALAVDVEMGGDQAEAEQVLLKMSTLSEEGIMAAKHVSAGCARVCACGRGVGLGACGRACVCDGYAWLCVCLHECVSLLAL